MVGTENDVHNTQMFIFTCKFELFGSSIPQPLKIFFMKDLKYSDSLFIFALDPLKSSKGLLYLASIARITPQLFSLLKLFLFHLFLEHHLQNLNKTYIILLNICIDNETNNKLKTNVVKKSLSNNFNFSILTDKTKIFTNNLMH